MESVFSVESAARATQIARGAQFDKYMKQINQGIINATMKGCDSTCVLFSEEISSESIIDQISDALFLAGYEVPVIGSTDVEVSWGASARLRRWRS